MENQFTTSIWGDEGFSAILSIKSLPEIIKIISRDTSPPLWNIFEHFAFRIFGTQETVIRGLSLIFYLIAAYFVYKIGALLYSRKTAVISLLLTLLNPFFFIYAFEGRMYSILAAGVAGSMYFFIKSFFGEGGKKTRIGYVFFSLWALYSHHFSIFILFLQGLWFIYEFLFGRKKTARKFFKTFIFIFIGYLPWVYPLYMQIKMVGGGFWLGKPDPKDLLVLIFDYLSNGIKSPLKLPIIEVYLYQAGLFFVLSILVIRNWFKSYKKSIILILWFLLPILSTYMISQKFQSIFFNRYLLYSIPGAMLLLASNRRGIPSIILISIVLTIFSVIDYSYFTNPTKLPFRQFSQMVKDELKKDDYLINWNSSSHHLWETKYYGIPAPIYIPPEGNDLPYFVGTALMEEADIVRSIPESTSRVGAVTSGNVEEVKIQGYTKLKVSEIGGLKIVWLEKTKNEEDI